MLHFQRLKNRESNLALSLSTSTDEWALYVCDQRLKKLRNSWEKRRKKCREKSREKSREKGRERKNRAHNLHGTYPAPWKHLRRVLRGVFTWEKSHRREFHTGMTFWFRITFTWWLGHFEGTLHVEIYNRKHHACATRSSLPADRFHPGMGGRFAFTWYRCKISYRSEILASVRQPGWTRAGATRAGMTFCGGIM